MHPTPASKYVAEGRSPALTKALHSAPIFRYQIETLYHGVHSREAVYGVMAPEECLAKEMMYGILIQSPSFTEDPPGPCGAGVAERSESERPARPAAELQHVVTLILTVFL